MPAAEAASRRVCATRAASTCPPRHSPPRNVPKHIWPHAQPPRIAAELPTAPEAAVGAQRRCGTAAVQRRSRQPGWRPRRLPGANVPVPAHNRRHFVTTHCCHNWLLRATLKFWRGALDVGHACAQPSAARAASVAPLGCWRALGCSAPAPACATPALGSGPQPACNQASSARSATPSGMQQCGSRLFSRACVYRFDERARQWWAPHTRPGPCSRRVTSRHIVRSERRM